MDDLYIRFMAPITPLSTERLFNLFDKARRDGVSRLHLLLNSPGGSVAHGLAIHNFLKGSPIEIITHNFGTVDSIGVIIYCAGNKRLAVPHARFLLHPVLAQFGQGHFDEHHIRERQNGLQTDQQNIAKVISSVVNKTAEEVLENIHSRKTFDAEQAKEFGLVEEIKSELLPPNATLETVRESEAVNQNAMMRQIMPQVQISPPPNGGETNAYIQDYTFTQAF